MTTTSASPETAAADERAHLTNGAALAAFVGAGVGAFSMGFFVIVNEAGLFVAPSLYGPSGGVSGRTTFATVVWLLAWAVLHGRWKHRQLAAGPVCAGALALVALGIVLTFPPVWGLF